MPPETSALVKTDRIPNQGHEQTCPGGPELEMRLGRGHWEAEHLRSEAHL